MTPTDLKTALDLHRRWLRGEAGGSRADLRCADLSGAILSCADLRCADLRCAILSGADLSGAILSRADLSGAILSRADLSGAELRCAILRGAILRRADLSGAILSGADLSGADLRRAKEIPALAAAQLTICPEGLLVGWKKLRGGVVAELRIPPEARRSNATGRKCRAEFADVVALHAPDGTEASVGYSIHDSAFRYVPGERVTCDAWNEDRWTECGGGIHFLLTRIEAEDYS